MIDQIPSFVAVSETFHSFTSGLVGLCLVHARLNKVAAATTYSLTVSINQSLDKKVAYYTYFKEAQGHVEPN